LLLRDKRTWCLAFSMCILCKCVYCVCVSSYSVYDNVGECAGMNG
jgi:hypothetical protein